MSDGAGPSARRAWAEVVLVVVVVFCAALAGFEWHRADRDRSQLTAATTADDERRAVADVAAKEAVALFTYDYRDLAATQSRIASLATGSFARRDASGNAAVQRQLLAAKATGSATVLEETVSDADAGHASAFVVLSTRSSSNGGPMSTAIVDLHLDLQQVDGSWKVSEVQTLKSASD